MKSNTKRLNRESKTVSVMIQMYCDFHHHPESGLCDACQELSDYADKRVSKCPYGEDKPVCVSCPTHCYVKQKRQAIQEVMRFSGPRMAWRHPWLAIMHLVDSSKKVDDLESISQENNSIYVMASLDGTKKGRRHLLQLQIDKDKTLLLGQVNIYKLLKKLARNVDDIETQKFIHKALSEKSIDLEAHSVHSNDLYLGFKSPHGDLGETIILKLDNIQQVMNGETVKGGIWKKITLLDPQTGAPSSLSDMMFMDEQLLLLSVNKNISMDDSHLWSYLTSTSKLTPIKSFHGLSAEGVTATNAKNELMVVFDGNGKTQSRFLPISIN